MQFKLKKLVFIKRKLVLRPALITEICIQKYLEDIFSTLLFLMDEKSTEDKDLYVFKAPSAGNETEAQDETGAIVGAVAACLIISAVLLFLWKVIFSKKDIDSFANNDIYSLDN